MTLVTRSLELLKAKGMGHVAVFVGGIIPDEDVAALTVKGVAGILGPGTNTDDVVQAVRLAAPREG